MSPIDQAARTAQAGQEMLLASGDVIARRLEIVAAALCDPGRADLTELGLMGSEKVEVLTASVGAGLNGAAGLAAVGATLTARETAAAHDALTAVLAAPDLSSAVRVQTDWATAVMARAANGGWTLGRAMLQLQADVLAPIHAAATANARRLGK